MREEVSKQPTIKTFFIDNSLEKVELFRKCTEDAFNEVTQEKKAVSSLADLLSFG
jgi:hypothetical protein